MTPSKLRIILFAALFLLASAGTGLFMFGYGKISEYANQAQQTAAQATASNDSLQDLIATKKTLEDNSATVQRVALLAAKSQSYVYQEQIIKDINQFATEAGLSVTNISFADIKTTGVASNSSAPATTPAAAAAPAPAGVKSVTATVSLKNPVDYNKMLNFIHLVEQSLFRMQISQVTLSRAADGGTNDVSSDVLTIEVYVR